MAKPAKPKPAKGSKPESGKTGKKGGDGPTLGRTVRLWLLTAIAPLLAAAWCAVGWDGGPVLRHGPADLRLAPAWGRLGLLLLGALVLSAAFSLFWPLAQGLRRTSVGWFTTRKVAGALPMVLAVPLWLGFYAAGLLALGTGAVLAWQALGQLGFPARIQALVG